MHQFFKFKTSQEDFLARITEAAYNVVLRQGLQRSFVDVELELWQQVRNVLRTELLLEEPTVRPWRGRENLAALTLEVA